MSRIKDTCLTPRLFVVEQILPGPTYRLSQYIEDVQYIEGYENIFRYELKCIMLQIYAFLRLYQDSLAHCNLTTDSIELVWIDSHIFNFTYENGNLGTLSFHSTFLVKIGDYGNVFVNDFTPPVQSVLCGIKECEPDCGNSKGYRFNDLKLDHSSAINFFAHVSDNYLKEKRYNSLSSINGIFTMLDRDLRKISNEWNDFYKERFNNIATFFIDMSGVTRCN